MVRKRLTRLACGSVVAGGLIGAYGVVHIPISQPDLPSVLTAEGVESRIEIYESGARNVMETANYIVGGGLILMLLGAGALVYLGDSSSNPGNRESKYRLF